MLTRRPIAHVVRLALVSVAALASLVGAGACRSATTGPRSAGDGAAPADTAPATTTVEPSAGTEGAPVTVSSSAGTATARIEALLPELAASLGRAGDADGDLMLPCDAVVDADGAVYVSDATGVQKFGADGAFLSRIGGEVLKTAMGGLALGPDGRLYVTGYDAAVHVFDAQGREVGTIGGPGSDGTVMGQPVDVAVDVEGAVYVADAGNATVEKFAADGTHLQTVGRRGQARGEFTSARSVAVDADGRIYVGSGDDFLVQRFAADGTYLDAFGLAHAGENAWRVGGIALDAAGNIYLSQALAGRIQCFAAADRQLVWELGTVGVGDDAFRSPMGLAVDGDRLYVADQQNHRVQVYDLAR